MAVVYFVFQRESLIFDEQNLLVGSILNINLGGQHMLNPFSCNPASFTAIVRPMIEWVHWGVPKFPEYEVSQGFDVHAERNIYQVLVIDGELQKICPISLFLCLYEQCLECWSSVFHKTIFFLLIWVHFSFQALRPFISYHTFGVEALKTLDKVLCLFTLKTSQ